MASKLYLIPNPDYQKSGIKSYVHLMRKYRIRPTKEGPYSIGHTLHQTGRPFSDKPVGGRASFRQVIQKHLPDGQIEAAGADDIQQDAPCFLPVQIGAPPQTVHLVPDTASPDLWVRFSMLFDAYSMGKQTLMSNRSALQNYRKLRVITFSILRNPRHFNPPTDGPGRC